MTTFNDNLLLSRLKRTLTTLVVIAACLSTTTYAHAASVYNGKFVFWRTSKLSTPISGRIAALHKRVGDQVKEGEVLATIDARQLKADLAVAQQAVKTAEAELANEEARLKRATMQHNRFANLKNSPAFSGARFEDTKNDVAVARTAVAAARARIEQSKAEAERQAVNVQLTEIKAPFDGIIARQLLTVGSLVSPENPDVLLLVDNRTPEIEVSIPIKQIASLAIGSEVEFSVDSGKRQRAKVRAILLAGKAQAKERRVRLIIVEPQGNYADTATVKIHVPGS